MYGLNLNGKQINDNLKYYALKESKIVKSDSGHPSSTRSTVDIPCANDELVAVYVEQGKSFYVAYRKNNVFRLMILGRDINVHYYIFSNKLSKQGDYGIEYRNAQGELVYSSNHKYLRIFGTVRYIFNKAMHTSPQTTPLKKDRNQKVGYILGTQFSIPKYRSKHIEIPAVWIDETEINVHNAYLTTTRAEWGNVSLHYIIDFYFADLTNL